MIKPEQIPDEVVEAAAVDVSTIMGCKWEQLHEDDRNIARSIARAAIAAALNAWPAIKICYFLPQGRTIMLPFPNVSKYPRKEGDK